VAEDDILQILVARGLAWEEIKKDFSLCFAKRTLRFLQMHYTRNSNRCAFLLLHMDPAAEAT
jgi:hypothetical protein